MNECAKNFAAWRESLPPFGTASEVEDEIAAEARRAEREACARLAETVEGDFERDTAGRTEAQTRRGIAAAIRARNT